MPFVAPELQAEFVNYSYAVREDLLGERGPTGRALSPFYYSGDVLLHEIELGETRYEFRNTLAGHFYPVGSGGFEFVADPLSPYVVGRGDSREAAYEDWRDRVHVTFQGLIRKRPFEMDVADRGRWRALESLIDVAKYRRSTPVTMRQLGRVRYRQRSVPSGIAWSDGRKDVVSFSQAPSIFGGLRPGQWVDAVVQRDPATGKLIRILDLAPIPEVRLMTLDQQQEFLGSLPSGDSLPECNLDWTERE